MINTERLTIKPLTHHQLLKYIENNHSLEAELGLSKTTRIISSELKEALEQAILPMVNENADNYLYYTLWTIVSKAENRMVGDLCFMGLPNAEGSIEIGYGTYDEFQRKGFMTEAVGGMIEWAKHQPDIKAITASTDKTNVASHTVLEKNNFEKTGESDELFHWRLQF
jgi:RimJ/RimL family protein N-acetyltransferase